VPKLKFRGSVTSLPPHLHGVMPNNSSTRDLFTDVLQQLCSYKRIRGWFGYYHTLCDSSESADSEKKDLCFFCMTTARMWCCRQLRMLNVSILVF